MFDALRAAIDGTVIQPGDPDYDAARKPPLEWFHDVRPQAVVRVTSAGAVVRPFGSGRVYPNFPDPDLDDPLRAYHGANLDRLGELKQRYDPDRFFHFAQGL